ncbi:MAG: extracellular solute-binding protein, partial [Pseudomonadales bacterium]
MPGLFRFVLLVLLVLFCHFAKGDTYPYAHGVSYLEPLHYTPLFEHFDYVDPNASKGGRLRAGVTGTWDSFNNILNKGRIAAGAELLGAQQMLYDRLLERALDEPASYYGRLASGIWVSDDHRQFAFKIRDGAYWHDGKPLTAADVLWTFETYKTVASATIRTALRELSTIEQISPDEVLFTARPDAEGGTNLIFAVGAFPILPRHYWESRDITQTTLEPPLGSGPYRYSEFDIGRYVFLERVENYWGQDIPVNRGRYNFDVIKYDYFRDENIMLEAVKGDLIDVRAESVSKLWVTAYNFPARERGLFKRELIELSRPWGLNWPMMWNLARPRLQDIRVREALMFLSDFHWTNRVLMYDFYEHAKSFFYNSNMESSGLPSEAELELLEPWRGRIPDRVFTHEWTGNDASGPGYQRENIRRAIALFAEAGWEIRDGVMTHVETGAPFTLDLVFVSTYGVRQEEMLLANLNLIGIKTTARAPEISNWLYRMREGKFDGGVYNFIPTYTPGLTLRNRFGSASADSPAGQNWGNIRDPAVDAMIQHVIDAATPEQFYAAIHALDRILLWNFYYIPSLGTPG